MSRRDKGVEMKGENQPLVRRLEDVRKKGGMFGGSGVRFR